MEASSSTAQQNNPQGNTNDQVSDDVNVLPFSFIEEFKSSEHLLMEIECCIQVSDEVNVLPPFIEEFKESGQLFKEMENSQNSRQGNINDQVSDDVTLSLTKEFKQLHLVSGERCIYRVPKRLRVLNENAYTPRCVSIGPYHHGKDELKAMEEHKIKHLQHFLELRRVSLETVVSCVRYNETRLRNYYQERIDLSSEIFVRLMVVDAAFVVMLMLGTCSTEFHNEDDLLFNRPWMIQDIKHDMILLENQLPFFILHEFLSLPNLVTLGLSLMVQISSHFMSWMCTSWEVNHSEELNFSNCKHLVDFLRIGQQPLKQNMYKPLDDANLPSAMELHRAGVKFKRAESLRLVDINFNFHDGILKIPQLKLYDSTEFLFKNLQAFEQSHFLHGESYFNDYIFMVNLLVTNGKDVEILTKKEIIKNWLHDNEQVVHLLHNLSKENLIDSEKFYFSDVVNNLNQYCRKRRNRWMASLIQNYFYNPWAVSSVIAATLLLLLTFVQTICSIFQVKQQQ